MIVEEEFSKFTDTHCVEAIAVERHGWGYATDTSGQPDKHEMPNLARRVAVRATHAVAV